MKRKLAIWERLRNKQVNIADIKTFCWPVLPFADTFEPKVFVIMEIHGNIRKSR